jgi:hypothetical protein
MPLGEITVGDCTAETPRTQRKEYLVKNYSELCVLCVSAVNILSHETQKNQGEKPDQPACLCTNSSSCW